MKRWIVLLILVVFSINISSQDLKKAPKQISVELGYRYLLSNDLVAESRKSGYGFLIDYAWQLSGYTSEKHPVYLSVPIGYTFIPGSVNEAAQKMLHYGWAVRHMLGKPKTVQTFIGYGLLLNQITVEDRVGQLFGHQTRFSFGANLRIKDFLTPYINLEYSMARHPQFDIEESSWLRFIDVKAGVRFK